MNKGELTTLACRLGNRVKHIDSKLQQGIISKERHMTERIAIDTIISYIAEEIGYEPYDYMYYSDVIIAKEEAKRKAETERKLKKARDNRTEAEIEAEVLFNAFLAGMKISSF